MFKFNQNRNLNITKICVNHKLICVLNYNVCFVISELYKNMDYKYCFIKI